MMPNERNDDLEVRLLAQDEGMTAGAQVVLPPPFRGLGCEPPEEGNFEEIIDVLSWEEDGVTLTTGDLEALEGEAA